MTVKLRLTMLVGALLALSGCDAEKPEARIDSIADMKGRELACLSGSTFQKLTEGIQDGIVYRSFNDFPTSMIALRTGKIDGVAIDEPIARFWVARNPSVYRIAQVYTSDSYAFAFKKGSPLVAEINKVIRRLGESGDLARYVSKWCEPAKPDVAFEKLPEGPGHTGSRGTLRAAFAPELEPVAYLVGGEVVGFEPEILRRIAWEMDMKVEFQKLSFGGLIESVASGKADLAGSAIIVTPEREKSVDFAEPYHRGGVSLLVRSEKAGACSGSWGRSLVRSFRRTFVEENRWRDILAGLGQTLVITVFAVLLGTALAFPVWLLRTSRNRFARGAGDAYVAVMQGTPILVVLMILYYVIFGNCDISAPVVAVFGFALNFAAYAGEMLRTGIAAVPAEQREAALAIGFTPFEAFRRVVFPQALRHVLPVYRGEVVGLLKATSVVGYIAVIDLTKASDLVRSRTYEAFFPLVSTAVIYFVCARVVASMIGSVDRLLTPIVRRKKGVTA